MRALAAAVEAGDAAAVAAALATGLDPDADLYPASRRQSNQTALYEACANGHLACAQALLAAQADPNSQSIFGMPLHVAIWAARRPCSRLGPTQTHVHRSSSRRPCTLLAKQATWLVWRRCWHLARTPTQPLPLERRRCMSALAKAMRTVRLLCWQRVPTLPPSG